jgi:hypothetical protein
MMTRLACRMIVVVTLLVPTLTSAQVTDEQVERMRDAAEQLGEAARARVEPLPEGETQPLRAVVMAVTGRSQWRSDAEAEWRNAQIDDVLEAGAMIRTGRRSSMTLRVGQNATVLVDRNSRVTLPQVLQDGDTLRTVVEVKRGRSDFKVDRVGLTNDFSVVTPSATLAVRGTGYAVLYGGLEGTQIDASRMNEMFAIEVQYFLSRYTYYLSRGAASSDTHENPAVNELFKTFGPPRILSAFIEDTATPYLLQDSFERNPLYYQQQIENKLAQLEATEAELVRQQMDDSMPDGFDFDFDIDYLDFGFDDFNALSDIAEFICRNLLTIFDSYEQFLKSYDLTTKNIDQPLGELQAFCGGIEIFEDEDLIDILTVIVAYCENQHDNPEDFSLCVISFLQAAGQVWSQGGDFELPCR